MTEIRAKTSTDDVADKMDPHVRKLLQKMGRLPPDA